MDGSGVVAHALVRGLSTVLPISASGHEACLEVLVEAGRALPASRALAQWGVLLGLLIVTRKRLAQAIIEGIRGLARPTVLQSSEGGRDAVCVTAAAIVSAAVGLTLEPRVALFSASPTMVGGALLLGATGLLSTALAPPPHRASPPPLAAALVGLGHGLAVVPGASRVGAAFVLLRWLGLSAPAAAELSLLLSVPVLALDAAVAGGNATLGGLGGAAVLAVVAGLAAALVAAACWRPLYEHGRTTLLVPWLVVIALGLLAYGRALPSEARGRPDPQVTGSTAVSLAMPGSPAPAGLPLPPEPPSPPAPTCAV